MWLEHALWAHNLHDLGYPIYEKDIGIFRIKIFFEVLGVELRALGLLSRCSTMWATSPALFALVILG
jgi:hypothetical protein